MTDPGLARSRRTAHTCSTLTCSSLNCGLASHLPQLHSVTARAVLVACNRRSPPTVLPPTIFPHRALPGPGCVLREEALAGPPGSPGRPRQFPNPRPQGHEPQLRSRWDPAQSPGASGRLAAQEQAGAVGNGRRGTRPAVCWLPSPRGRAQPLSAGNKDGSCPKRRIGRLGLSGSVRRPVCGGYR